MFKKGIKKVSKQYSQIINAVYKSLIIIIKLHSNHDSVTVSGSEIYIFEAIDMINDKLTIYLFVC